MPDDYAAFRCDVVVAECVSASSTVVLVHHFGFVCFERAVRVLVLDLISLLHSSKLLVWRLRFIPDTQCQVFESKAGHVVAPVWRVLTVELVR